MPTVCSTFVNPVSKPNRMKNLLYIASILTTLLSSCKTDECKDVNCNNGSCKEGICLCESGYSGANCETEERLAFVGDYSVTDACDSGVFDYEISIAANGDNIFEVTVSNIGDFNFTVDALAEGNSLSIEEQTVNGYTVAGSGTLTNGTLNIDYSLTNGNGQTLNCELEGLVQE